MEGVKGGYCWDGPAVGGNTIAASASTVSAGVMDSQTAVPASSYKGNPLEALWLPNAQVAKIWTEYVKNGTVADVTPPLPPFNVRVASRGSGGTLDVCIIACCNRYAGES